jgi:hypothetical protein
MRKSSKSFTLRQLASITHSRSLGTLRDTGEETGMDASGSGSDSDSLSPSSLTSFSDYLMAAVPPVGCAM